MENASVSLSLWCAVLLAVAAQAQTQTPNATQRFDLSGEVKLLAAGKVPVKDASNVVAWLSPQGPVRPAALTHSQEKYRMVQRNKMFEPSLLVVPVGSNVDFPNLDPWFHNVFSLYRGKRFDLGLYEAGSQKTIKFDRPGASYIFCNIHPEMAAVVLAVDSDLFAISDRSGRFTIKRVPAGRYLLEFWYENSDPRNLDSFDRPIEIDGDVNLPAVSIPVTDQNVAKHKNKFGRNYDPKAGSADY